MVLALALTSLTVTIAWRVQRAQIESGEDRRARLASLVTARQGRVRGLESQLATLRRSLDRTLRTSRHGRLRTLATETERLALVAGLRAVGGDGVEIILTDSPPEHRPAAQAADFEIQDVDLQLVVNQLWSVGAEAIAVNGQRLVATSAIRAAGGTILVNYRVLSPPYRVVALGNPDALVRRFQASALARRFRGWVDIYHLGFTIRTVRNASVPAFRGSLVPRYAELDDRH